MWLRRQIGKRLVLSELDWLIFVWLCGFWPDILHAVSLIRPATIVCWHRAGFRAYWRWRSRPKRGASSGSDRTVSADLGDELSQPTVGCTKDAR